MTKKSAARRYDIAGMVDLLSYLHLYPAGSHVNKIIETANLTRESFYRAMGILVNDELVTYKYSSTPHGKRKEIRLTERGKRVAKRAFEYERILEEVQEQVSF